MPERTYFGEVPTQRPWRFWAHSEELAQKIVAGYIQSLESDALQTQDPTAWLYCLEQLSRLDDTSVEAKGDTDDELHAIQKWVQAVRTGVADKLMASVNPILHVHGVLLHAGCRQEH